MKTIPLSNGKFALIDDRDFKMVSRHTWRMSERGYASRNWRQRRVYMHRQIMNAPIGIEVDHKNRNRLDNRRKNLRFCTADMQQYNRGMDGRNTSGFKGVSTTRKSKIMPWRARIGWRKQQILIGHFKRSKDAARAYDKAAKRLFGEFARTNKMLGLL